MLDNKLACLRCFINIPFILSDNNNSDIMFLSTTKKFGVLFTSSIFQFFLVLFQFYLALKTDKIKKNILKDPSHSGSYFSRPSFEMYLGIHFLRN